MKLMNLMKNASSFIIGSVIVKSVMALWYIELLLIDISELVNSSVVFYDFLISIPQKFLRINHFLNITFVWKKVFYLLLNSIL